MRVNGGEPICMPWGRMCEGVPVLQHPPAPPWCWQAPAQAGARDHLRRDEAQMDGNMQVGYRKLRTRRGLYLHQQPVHVRCKTRAEDRRVMGSEDVKESHALQWQCSTVPAGYLSSGRRIGKESHTPWRGNPDENRLQRRRRGRCSRGPSGWVNPKLHATSAGFRPSIRVAVFREMPPAQPCTPTVMPMNRSLPKLIKSESGCRSEESWTCKCFLPFPPP